jgi:hypothetical protein
MTPAVPVLGIGGCPGAGTVDDLDAGAAARTALRHARAGSHALPDAAERFSDGLLAAIHV